MPLLKYFALLLKFVHWFWG